MRVHKPHPEFHNPELIARHGAMRLESHRYIWLLYELSLHTIPKTTNYRDVRQQTGGGEPDGSPGSTSRRKRLNNPFCVLWLRKHEEFVENAVYTQHWWYKSTSAVSVLETLKNDVCRIDRDIDNGKFG